MPIATQPFGRTGHMSTRTLFGAASLSHVTQEEADQTLEVLLQYGVNHIDVAASYGDAELRIDGVRDPVRAVGEAAAQGLAAREPDDAAKRARQLHAARGRSAAAPRTTIRPRPPCRSR